MNYTCIDDRKTITATPKSEHSYIIYFKSIYIRSCLLSFKRSRSLKAVRLVSFDCAKFCIMFNLKDFPLVLCEIIERQECKHIIICFIDGLSYSMYASINDTVVVCARTSVKYLNNITLLIGQVL